MSDKKDNPFPAVIVLTPEEFDRVMYDLQNQTGPSESIKRGAELLRRLYGQQPSVSPSCQQ